MDHQHLADKGTEIQEFVALWEAINDVKRDVASEDQIL